MIGLKITKLPSETWRQCALRYGKRHGLEHEVAEAYDKIAKDEYDDEAAWEAVNEWDCCDLHDDEEGVKDGRRGKI